MFLLDITNTGVQSRRAYDVQTRDNGHTRKVVKKGIKWQKVALTHVEKFGRVGQP